MLITMVRNLILCCVLLKYCASWLLKIWFSVVSFSILEILSSMIFIVICLLQFSVCTSVIFIHSFPWIGGSTGFLVVCWGKSKNFFPVTFELLPSYNWNLIFCLKFRWSETISFCLQVRVFYAVRLFLAFLSVITDTVLVVALSRKYGKRLASYTLAMLCLTSGCFFASTSGWAISIFLLWSVHSISGFLTSQIFIFLIIHFCFQFSYCYISYFSGAIYSMKCEMTMLMTLFSRFFAQFILYVCHVSFIRVISSW